MADEEIAEACCPEDAEAKAEGTESCCSDAAPLEEVAENANEAADSGGEPEQGETGPIS